MKVKCIAKNTRYDNCFFSNIEVGEEYEVQESFNDITGIRMHVIKTSNNKALFHRTELFEIIE